MASGADIGIVRDLARRYAERASLGVRKERIGRCRESNARKRQRPQTAMTCVKESSR